MKRFYKDVGIAEADTGFSILLDKRPVRTPRHAPFVLPTRALAEAVAGEWRGQGETVQPDTMPLTKLAYAAIDGAAERARIAEQALAYARSDLLCYRAEGPDELVIRQARQWGPILDWLHKAHGARLRTATGIAYVEQPSDALNSLAEWAGRLDPFALVALHAATSITGSLTLGLAVLEAYLPAADAFALSRLDEIFQAEKWGQDAEAEARAAHLLADLEAAERFARLSCA